MNRPGGQRKDAARLVAACDAVLDLPAPQGDDPQQGLVIRPHEVVVWRLASRGRPRIPARPRQNRPRTCAARRSTGATAAICWGAVGSSRGTLGQDAAKVIEAPAAAAGKGGPDLLERAGIVHLAVEEDGEEIAAVIEPAVAIEHGRPVFPPCSTPCGLPFAGAYGARKAFPLFVPGRSSNRSAQRRHRTQALPSSPNARPNLMANFN